MGWGKAAVLQSLLRFEPLVSQATALALLYSGMQAIGQHLSIWEGGIMIRGLPFLLGTIATPSGRLPSRHPIG